MGPSSRSRIRKLSLEQRKEAKDRTFSLYLEEEIVVCFSRSQVLLYHSSQAYAENLQSDMVTNKWLIISNHCPD